MSEGAPGQGAGNTETPRPFVSTAERIARSEAEVHSLYADIQAENDASLVARVRAQLGKLGSIFSGHPEPIKRPATPQEMHERAMEEASYNLKMNPIPRELPEHRQAEQFGADPRVKYISTEKRQY